MRYQQKQMHETAQKKSEMFDETQKLLTSSLGAGKVREFNLVSVALHNSVVLDETNGW